MSVLKAAIAFAGLLTAGCPTSKNRLIKKASNNQDRVDSQSSGEGLLANDFGKSEIGKLH